MSLDRRVSTEHSHQCLQKHFQPAVKLHEWLRTKTGHLHDSASTLPSTSGAAHLAHETIQPHLRHVQHATPLSWASFMSV